jgi:hypothetical protein
MSYLKFIILSIIIFPVIAFAQNQDSTSNERFYKEVLYTSSAKILPYFSIGISVIDVPYGTPTPEFKGSVSLNIKDIGEIAIGNNELVGDYEGHLLHPPLVVDIKMKLFSESCVMPATSILFRNMYPWQYLEYMGANDDRPDLEAIGFHYADFSYRIMSMSIAMSKQITNRLFVSIGGGVQSLEVNNNTMYTYAIAPYHFSNTGITTTYFPFGYLNGQYSINHCFTILAEAQNYITLTPILDQIATNMYNPEIKAGNSYMFVLGARLAIAKAIGLGAFARRIESYVGSSSSDIVLRLDLALPNQQLKLTE